MTDIITLAPGELITAPGLYAMPEAAYHADPVFEPSLSRSIAHLLVKRSPRHARAAHPRLTKQKDKKVDNDRTREIGSAAHAMLLGQDTEICVIDAEDFKTKAAQQERRDAQERGAIPVPAPDYETACEMVEVARRELRDEVHPAVRSLVDPTAPGIWHNEVTGVCIDPCGNIPVRIRMDRLFLGVSDIAILDYKTTGMSVDRAEITRALYGNDYHFQDAFYRRCARNLFPEIDRHEKRLSFIFIMQEQEPPYELAITKVDAPGRLIGEKMVSNAFLLWKKCVTEDWWPGYPKGLFEAEMPAWVDTQWCTREIEHPYLQNLGFDPMPFFEVNPYKPKPIMEPN